MSSKTTVAVVAVIVIVVIAAAAAALALGSGDGGDSGTDAPDTPTENPLMNDLTELDIGDELVFDVSGSYANRYASYTIDGTETYTVIGKTSDSVTFEVNGTTYAKSGSQSVVFSQSNGDVKTWNMPDPDQPHEDGVLDTPYGPVDVMIVDFDLPDTAAGYRVTDLGSYQYWTETGFGVKQSMNYSIDSTNEVTKVTKTLVSVTTE